MSLKSLLSATQILLIKALISLRIYITRIVGANIVVNKGATHEEERKREDAKERREENANESSNEEGKILMAELLQINQSLTHQDGKTLMSDEQVSVTQESLLKTGVCLLDEALMNLMEVKNEIGVELANRIYKAIRTYEKYEEKKLREQERD